MKEIMKKMTAVLLTLILLLSLCACGGAKTNTTAAPEKSTEATEKTSEEATKQETTKAPTQPATTAAPTQPATTEAPTTQAPTQPATTAAPTKPETTAAPTEAPTTEVPATAAPTPETKEVSGVDHERVIGETFRFTVPADWKVDDKSYIAKNGLVYISFFKVPTARNGQKLPDGAKLDDEDFPVKLAEYLDELHFYGPDAKLEIQTSEASYAMEKQHLKTDSGLPYRDMLIRIKSLDGTKLLGSAIFEVYEWDAENYLLIDYEFGLVGSTNALDCGKVIHKTLEKIAN